MPLDRANFFNEGSPYLDHPLLTSERSEEEVDFIITQTGISEGDRILDVGCGMGRHSYELVKRGYRVVGIDPSEAMINAARNQPEGLNPQPDFIQVRAEDYKADLPFDTAICLYTTLGQIEVSDDNRDLVYVVSQNLRPGAFFIIEIPNKQWVVSNLKTREHFKSNNQYTEITRSYHSTKSMVSENFSIFRNNSEKSFLLRYHLFDLFEVNTLLAQAGFEVIHNFGGYEAIPISNEKPVIVIVSQKQGN